MTPKAKMDTTEKANIVLAIDPGSEQSAAIYWTGNNITDKGILPNYRLLETLQQLPDEVRRLPVLVIEKIESMGMPVGASIFETVFWVGRFWQAWRGRCELIPRREVKMHLCNSMRAKDSNIRQALIDRFGPPGTKKDPGLTYGLRKDLWQAFALAVTYWDLHTGNIK